MKISNLVCCLFFAAIVLGVLAKMIYVPITHDESWTITRYTPYSIWSIMMYPDSWPNNHILNTIGTKIFSAIGGYNHFTVRLTSFLALFIYAFGAFRISKLMSNKNHLYGFLCFVLFFANPFFNEFFALCRGYALSNAFLLLSIFMFLKSQKKKENKFIWFALLFSSLSAYANFTALIHWAASVVIGFFILLSQRKKEDYSLPKSIAKLVLIVLSFLSLIIVPIIKMRKDNQFQYWTSNGFFKDTIFSSTEKWRMGAKLFYEFDRVYIAYFILFLFILMSLMFLLKCFKYFTEKKINWTPFLICFSLLGLTGIINILQTKILGTPNLTGRTALLYFPLFISSLIAFLMELSQINKLCSLFVKILLSITVIFVSIHLVDRHNHRQVHEWWYDQNNIEVINYLKELEKPILLKTHWMFHPSFNYYDWVGAAEHIQLMEYDKNITPESTANYYYVFESDLEALKANYQKLQKFGWDRWLLKKID